MRLSQPGLRRRSTGTGAGRNVASHAMLDPVSRLDYVVEARRLYFLATHPAKSLCWSGEQPVVKKDRRAQMHPAVDSGIPPWSRRG